MRHGIVTRSSRDRGQRSVIMTSNMGNNKMSNKNLGMLPRKSRLLTRMDPSPKHGTRPGTPQGTAGTQASTEALEFLQSGTYPIVDARKTAELKPVVDEVTLVIYGWHNVQPGTMSWVFPSLPSALSAARAMRNAIEWVVIRGTELMDLSKARAEGAVLAESVT